jgi:hypothetical protein
MLKPLIALLVVSQFLFSCTPSGSSESTSTVNQKSMNGNWMFKGDGACEDRGDGTSQYVTHQFSDSSLAVYFKRFATVDCTGSFTMINPLNNNVITEPSVAGTLEVVSLENNPADYITTVFTPTSGVSKEYYVWKKDADGSLYGAPADDSTIAAKWKTWDECAADANISAFIADSSVAPLKLQAE